MWTFIFSSLRSFAECCLPPYYFALRGVASGEQYILNDVRTDWTTAIRRSTSIVCTRADGVKVVQMTHTYIFINI